MWKVIIIFTSFFEVILNSNLISFHNIILPGDFKANQEFLCISDDLSDALVWNHPLTKSYWNIDLNKKMDIDEYEKVNFSNGTIPWQITHSYDVPMGPVYDSQWEHFSVYMHENYRQLQISDSHGKKHDFLKKTGALVFSIRGPSTASIFLCETKNVLSDFCYWIKINGKQNTKTIIRRCEQGIPMNSNNCSSQSDFIYTPIDSNEWKTFILKWEGKERKIKLYNESKSILTYHDNDYKFDKDLPYYVYFSNPTNDVLVRFHDYQYYHTTKTGSKMEYSIHYGNSKREMCIDILLGLCNHCGLHVRALKKSGKRLLTWKFFPDEAIYNLPMWKKVTLSMHNISDILFPIKLELETFSTLPDKNLTGHWAIREIHKYNPKDTLKRMSITIPLFIPNALTPIWCQRFSYMTSHMENLNLRSPLSFEPVDQQPYDDHENCSSDTIGPNCKTTCHRYFKKGCDSLIRCMKNHCYCNEYYPGCHTGLKIHAPSIAAVTSISAYAYSKAVDKYVKNSVIIGFELKANPDDKKIKRYAGRLGKSNNSDDKYYHTTFTNLRPATEYSVRMYISYKYGNKTKTIMGDTATFKTLPMTLGIPPLITMVQEGKGKAILSWKPPPSKNETIVSFIIYEEIMGSLLEKKPNLNEKKVIQVPYAESTPEYVVELKLLPSTHYKISVQAKGKMLKGNLSTIEIKSQSALTFKYDPSANVDDKNHLIHVIIPPVVHNTEHSILNIIVKGSPICKQGGSLRSDLRKMIQLKDNEISWMAASFSTCKTADKLFLVGDELIYNDVIANCPLHPGNSYVIYILVRERGDQNELQDFPALLWTSPELRISSNNQHWKYWVVPLVVFILISCGIVYRYYRR